MHLVLSAKEIVFRPMAELSVPQPSLSPRKPVPPWGKKAEPKPKAETFGRASDDPGVVEFPSPTQDLQKP